MGFLMFNQTIRVRMLLKFLSVFAHTMVLPYTVIYFSGKVGLSITTTLILIIALISMVGYAIGGKATDRIGRKKVIIISEVVTAIGFVIISYFNSLDQFQVIPIFIAFSLIYFFESAANPAYGALIIDVSTEDNRKLIYTYFMWISYVAFAVGSLVGAYFFELHATTLFLLVAIVGLISASCTYHFIVDTYKVTIAEKESKVPEAKPISISNLFSSRLFLLLCIGTMLISTLVEQFPNYLSIRLVSRYEEGEFNMTGYEMIGYLNLENTVIVAFGVVVSMKIVKRVSEKKSLLIGLIILGAGYIYISYVIQPILLMVGMLFIAIGELLYMPTLQSIVAKSIPEETRGTHLSILGLMSVIGGMIASLFIWGMQFIPENGITLIFIVLGILILFIYTGVYKLTQFDR
ncbi:MFS transporter [Viridibacillus arvi]|uniref:MFS transporter n=1 Tax=Viridibacillus arvi TaxID=263475 RepID=UPI00187BB088|nr:MFS transporter [Viridibacillus sp. JNUCC-6]QOV12207.1 MFS transporter [Viridibacillus sp. JNUCC-6]